jgi:hypothetical protein
MKLLCIGILLSLSCIAPDANAAQDCTPSGGQKFVCGPRNAEDLVLIPGTKWIVASSGDASSPFYLIDSRNGAWKNVQPQVKRNPKVGVPGCTQPPPAAGSNTHGLSVRGAAAGRSILYAVGHGPREAIEIYDVDSSGATPMLTWQGCVPMPPGLAANSVASFANGGLVATVLLMPGKSFEDSLARKPTGAVFEWSPGSSSFELVKGSELPGNNGIETSLDGSEVFVVSSGFQTVVAFSHSNPTRQLRTTRPLPFTPDNLRRDSAGRLVTAGMKNDVPACGGPPGPGHDLSKLASCPRGFLAFYIDPATMKTREFAQSEAIPVFSNATIALVVENQYFIGTFSGDRVAYGPIDK